MSGLKYYVIDTETNGLRSSYHTMTEIGIIRASDRVQLWRNIKCETPERSSLDALRITNKTLEDLAKGYDKEEVVEHCDNFFNEDGLTPAHRCIIGHNIFSFDKRFLFALWESVGKVFPAHLYMDTLPMIRHYAKQIGLIKPKVNLHAACDIVGLNKVASKHNAKHDSQNSFLLWRDLVEVKKIDYLPFIKTEPHVLKETNDEEDGLDPALLDL